MNLPVGRDPRMTQPSGFQMWSVEYRTASRVLRGSCGGGDKRASVEGSWRVLIWAEWAPTSALIRASLISSNICIGLHPCDVVCPSLSSLTIKVGLPCPTLSHGLPFPFCTSISPNCKIFPFVPAWIHLLFWVPYLRPLCYFPISNGKTVV